MTATESLILEQLAAINVKLECLLVPVARQAGKQTAALTDRKEILAANRAAREKARGK